MLRKDLFVFWLRVCAPAPLVPPREPADSIGVALVRASSLAGAPYRDKRGQRRRERSYAPDGARTWRVCLAAGRLQARSRWPGKRLLEVP